MPLIGNKLIIAFSTAYLNDLHFLIEYCIMLLTGMLLLHRLGVQCTTSPVGVEKPCSVLFCSVL